MKRVLIDSNIIDEILATPGLTEKIQQAAARGALTIVETHILRDQLEATRCETKRCQLLEVYEALPKTSVSTSGFILEVAKLDMADLGDDATSESLDRLRPSRDLGGLKDALLAATASGKADILVTEDTDLQKKATGESVPAWSFEQFHRFVRETAL